MKYKLAISNTALVTVKGTISDAGKPVNFNFKLHCDRLSADEMKQRFEGDFNVKDLMKELTKGWEGQRLVLDEEGKPAEFCEEALDELLNTSGMALVCFNAYSKEVSAQAKN